MAKPLTTAQKLMNEAIWCFADCDGALVLRRGDAYMLFIEQGWTKREADLMAFGPYSRHSTEIPHTIEEARAWLA